MADIFWVIFRCLEAVAVLSLLYLIYNIITYLFIGVPFVPTPKKYYSVIFENLGIDSESVIYDLGCGAAGFLLAAEKLRPKELIGFELSPLLVLWARFRIKFKKSKVKIFRKNFFEADLSPATIVYLFLTKSILLKLWPKIKKETKPGTKIVTLSDEIPGGAELMKTIKTRPDQERSSLLYLYQII
jgi:SAM-dependent methyltransferase